MLGATSLERCRVVNHDARDPARCRWAHDHWRAGVAESPVGRGRVRITTGFVEPHFFAGFSGGPKMVAPGLAGLETVMALHDAARIGHPNATGASSRATPSTTTSGRSPG